MRFRSKIDSMFIAITSVVLLIIGIVFLVPYIFDESTHTFTFTAVWLSIFFLTIAFILWVSFSINYTFHETYLHVKGGPFFSKIPYDEITKVAPTEDIYTGYRLLSSSKGIEIHYKSGILGSVKISPREKHRFLSELKKHCPQAEVYEK
ncbi:PH domain-containing protein [Halobacillus naozhouensis]|uniref:PH domain-containing protein n=1 Tax=Halobacillus naozhouensis TaxID=554880 RepID=A0ABY8J4K9_9BACI|nr:PH domain-containing protein [Halobacillus naozhouensis]WFT75695.1 PH domain-containing protein [Halobacillus naozhouensis]